MTELEELKAARAAAWRTANDAAYASADAARAAYAYDAAWHSADAAYYDYAACDAYEAELEKQEEKQND